MEGTTARQTHLEERIEKTPLIRRLVEDELLPRLDWSGPFELRPVKRGHNLVYFLNVEGRPKLVVRAGTRRWKFRRRIALHRYLSRRDIPVPEVRVAVAGALSRPKHGLFLSAEDRIRGGTILKTEEPLRLAAHAGELFARLHGLRHFPRPLFPEGRSTRGRLGSWLRSRADARLERFRKIHPNLEELADQARAWLDAWPSRAWCHSPRLCLTDLAKGNVIGTRDRVAIVDLVALRNSSPPHELGRARYQLLDGREAEWNAFISAYLAVADPSLAGMVREVFPLTEVLYLLRHMCVPKHSEDGSLSRRLGLLLDSTPGQPGPGSSEHTSFS